MSNEEKDVVFPEEVIEEPEVKTTEKTVEELTGEFADVVGVTEESETEVNETPVQFEEIELDEKKVTDIPIEPINEPQEQMKKRSKKKLAVLITAISVFVLLIGAYVGVSVYYADKFFPGTTVNGVNCSGKTLAEVEEILQGQVERYQILVLGRNDVSEQIKGVDIGITYIGYEQLEEAFNKQNQFLWPMAFFQSNDIHADVKFDYDKQKLDEAIAKLSCMQADAQVAPTNAAVVYQNGRFVIQEETQGAQLDAAKVSELIHQSVTAMERRVYLEEKGCYIAPQYTKESQEVIAAQKEANKYLSASITYSMDGIQVVVDKDDIAPWVSVNEAMATVINEAAVKAFTDTLGSTYNTPNKPGVLISPTGKEVNVESATLGRVVGSNEECAQLIKEIKEGKTITREPIFSRQQMADGEYYWGNNYVEVDITAQHMWVIQNGAIALETDIVTGKKGANDTPTGSFTIVEKMRNKTLRGRIVNGKPLYITPVSYWLRITWTGIGFHDATWQPSFGGDRYVTNGSHGCINMPIDMVKQMYDMVGVGTPVIVHY